MFTFGLEVCRISPCHKHSILIPFIPNQIATIRNPNPMIYAWLYWIKCIKYLWLLQNPTCVTFGRTHFLTLIYYFITIAVRLIICCIFYTISVRRYNTQPEMPVLQNCFNFDYSPCQSSWTAVRSCSEEICVTFTEYIRLWLAPSYCWKDKNCLRINIGLNRENSH
jgi:hypothetical protein